MTQEITRYNELCANAAIVTPFLIVIDLDAQSKALDLARGCYQWGILTGRENLSGSSLRGKARNYSGHYSLSAGRLLSRCRAAGIPIDEVVGPHNRRVLVIG